jgi:hypothetical protein
VFSFVDEQASKRKPRGWPHPSRLYSAIHLVQLPHGGWGISGKLAGLLIDEREHYSWNAATTERDPLLRAGPANALNPFLMVGWKKSRVDSGSGNLPGLRRPERTNQPPELVRRVGKSLGIFKMRGHA